MIPHIEAKENEIFVFNAAQLYDLKCLDGLTYRIGKQAYDAMGDEIEGEHPVFVKNTSGLPLDEFYTRTIRNIHVQLILDHVNEDK